MGCDGYDAEWKREGPFIASSRRRLYATLVAMHARYMDSSVMTLRDAKTADRWSWNISRARVPSILHNAPHTLRDIGRYERLPRIMETG